MTAIRDFVTFARNSWSYLGCDGGTGRWAMRRHYFARIIPRGIRYVLKCRDDRRRMAH